MQEGEMIFELLFPKRCPVCLDITVSKKRGICNECIQHLHYVEEPRCKKCGKQVVQEEIEYCYDCIKHIRSFEEGISLLDYSLPWVQRVIAQVKYYNHRQYLDTLCKELIQKHGEKIKKWNCEVMIPVPIHPSRRRKRGFNQAEEIAVRLKYFLNIPIDCSILKRVKKTLPQKELNNRERMENLTKAFIAKKTENSYKRVLLIDDIFTTGSTAEVCTRALKSEGVQFVYVLTLAIGRGN